MNLADPLPLTAALARASRQDAVLVIPAGADLGRRLASRIGAERVFAHHPPPPPWPAQGIPVVLGAVDSDVLVTRAGPWPGAGGEQWVRWRRLDTLYDSGLGLLVLGDADSATSVLDGANAALQLHRPPVLLDLRGGGGQRWPDVMGRLKGYRWVEVPGPLACALPAERTLPSVEPELLAPLAPVVPFTAELACAGLHPPEPDEPKGGRWTGAAAETWVVLPHQPGGSWRLALEIADWGNARDGFPIIVGGARLPVADQTASTLEYGPFATDPSMAPVLRVTLLPPAPVADPVRWPRKIGIRIAAARLTPA